MANSFKRANEEATKAAFDLKYLAGVKARVSPRNCAR